MAKLFDYVCAAEFHGVPDAAVFVITLPADQRPEDWTGPEAISHFTAQWKEKRPCPGGVLHVGLKVPADENALREAMASSNHPRFNVEARVETVRVAPGRTAAEEYVAPGHPTIELTTPSGERVAIDQEIAPLVSTLWRLGLETHESCQDLNGQVMICFPADDALQYLALVANVIHDAPEIVAGAVDAGRTGWGLMAFVDLLRADAAQPAALSLEIIVSFPRAHLTVITERLARVTVTPRRDRDRRHRRPS
jgi:hypothetical protein